MKMNCSVVLFGLIIQLCLSLPYNDDSKSVSTRSASTAKKEEWKDWKTKFNFAAKEEDYSDYDCDGQPDAQWIETKRELFQNFLGNRGYIMKHNKEAMEGKHTYFLKMNQFGDQVSFR